MDERQRYWLRLIIVEFIGTFALMFAGGGAIIMTAGQNLVAIALAHGLAIAVMVAAAGHISGGNYNPALTVGLVATRRMPVTRGIVYTVSQLAGAIVAALALKVIFPTDQVSAVNLGVPSIANAYSTGGALLAEIIATFFLMFVVYGTAVDRRGAMAIAGLVIGLVITMDIFAIGAVSGAAMNPARAFGPALVQGSWSDQWIYWVGPIIGAVAAAFVYNAILIDEPTPNASDAEAEPAVPRETRSVPARRRRR